jgi:RNA polymerase sigma-70 factor (ECF subfamily)
VVNPGGNRLLTYWFCQWRSPLRKFLICKGAVPIADLEDVAQEVFLRLLRYERSELIENPQAYLFKMESNVAAEWAIRARSRYAHEPKWLTELHADDTPEELVARGAVQSEIERAINTLAPHLRQVVKLRFTEGLGHEEFATQLGSIKFGARQSRRGTPGTTSPRAMRS